MTNHRQTDRQTKSGGTFAVCWKKVQIQTKHESNVTLYSPGIQLYFISANVYYFASAAVAVDSSHMTALSSDRVVDLYFYTSRKLATLSYLRIAIDTL